MRYIGQGKAEWETTTMPRVVGPPNVDVVWDETQKVWNLNVKFLTEEGETLDYSIRMLAPGAVPAPSAPKQLMALDRLRSLQGG